MKANRDSKNYTNQLDQRLFEYIDYLFKKKKDPPIDFVPANFIVNRWISMAHPSFPLMLNSTTNKWMGKIRNFNFTKFYLTILPKFPAKINYIKKKSGSRDDNDYTEISSLMECSQREIKIYNNLLEDLGIVDN